jgi:hypothetical protein
MSTPTPVHKTTKEVEDSSPQFDTLSSPSDAKLGIENYTQERLQRSLWVAEEFLARPNLSSRMTHFMSIYKSQLEAALNPSTDRDRLILIGGIIMMDKCIATGSIPNPA